MPSVLKGVQDDRFDTLRKRVVHAYSCWRGKGAATMPLFLWLHWTITGRYP